MFNYYSFPLYPHYGWLDQIGIHVFIVGFHPPVSGRTERPQQLGVGKYSFPPAWLAIFQYDKNTGGSWKQRDPMGIRHWKMVVPWSILMIVGQIPVAAWGYDSGVSQIQSHWVPFTSARWFIPFIQHGLWLRKNQGILKQISHGSHKVVPPQF